MLNFTDESFDKEISEVEKLVLVDFWMDGCSPCALLSPTMEKLAGEFSDRIIFAKANFEQVPAALQKYGIDAAPTAILFRKGEPMSGFVGLRQEDEIRTWLEDNLKKTMTKTDKFIEECREYAEKQGISLNSNEKIVEAIVGGLLNREEKFGQKYCPCRKITRDKEEDKKNICPCVFHLKEIERDGKCLCGLFVKKMIE